MELALQQVENALAAMSLASVAHLLPGDILVSNRRPLKLALNFAGAYYSPEWEVLTRETVPHHDHPIHSAG